MDNLVSNERDIYKEFLWKEQELVIYLKYDWLYEMNSTKI